jgi:P-type E1-E2 ATPase
MGIPTGILSGDQASAVHSVATRIQVPLSRAFPALSPTEKARVLDQYPNSLMVGDGVNDAVALVSASVGIAVYGGTEASMRAAGIYTASADPLEIVRLIRIARETMKVIHRNLGFTILYNVVVVSVALAGLFSPLFAAVIMPVSAFTVFCLSTWGTRALRSEFGKVGQ